MQCGQGKPFKSYKLGGTVTKQSSIPSYEKGGMVKRPEPTGGVYTKEMGEPPMEPDMMTSLKPAQRRAAEARMKAEQVPSGVGKPAKTLAPGQRPTNLRYTGEVSQGGKEYESFRDSSGREVLMPKK